MDAEVDLFDSTYRHFEAEVLARVRRSTFGEDFGQNSWTTAEEYREWARWLALGPAAHVLEVACGSGGPALFLAQLTGARVTGIDLNAHGIAAALARARASGGAERATFQQVDASARLPFAERAFDAVVCVDSAIHFPDRGAAFREWYRVLAPAGLALFTDPVVVTGLVTNAELAVRSSIGFFVFAPQGVNETLLDEAGFELVRRVDTSEHAAAVAGRWHTARAKDRAALVRIEGEERFLALQEFFAVVERLTRERRLSRFAYLARKRTPR